MVFLVGSRLYRCDSRSALLYRFNGCGRGFPQIIVPGHIAAHLHRLCHRRLYVMDTCALGTSYHCHGDGSLCRQHFRRSEMYPYGHSGQSIPLYPASAIWAPDWVIPVRHIHGMPCPMPPNGYCHSSCYWDVWNCSPSYFCSPRNSGNGIDLG